MALYQTRKFETIRNYGGSRSHTLWCFFPFPLPLLFFPPLLFLNEETSCLALGGRESIGACVCFLADLLEATDPEECGREDKVSRLMTAQSVMAARQQMDARMTKREERATMIKVKSSGSKLL